ncbi:PREDICTED: single-stranded DNA-bindig protein WHY2, mitochondrial [Nelumbo nucifera]|uniref:Single-stranded DNA-bindig protein WHY2, mitochondrial n=2 Tax=Nelumbo nucifera TaxID=4432 RepID=A0A1U8B945_NELNU|nr:PREDICTED: single-stranded DNA-bindig protein WHY2, mitochondrial [Nelumbo nucifera]DAD24320.1 TPA_asm: hypothetical protein HUJ06_025784 [Nelumbo nucifera]
MLKLSHFMRSRTTLSERLFFGKVGNTKDALWLHGSISRAGISTAGKDVAADGSYSRRVFASFTFYKGKASLSMTPRLPEFSKMVSGALKIERMGVILLEFCPAIGPRKYDYEKKQMFALSATEVGSLISLGAKDSCEFFHDPSMKKSNEGQVRKTMTITPMSESGGYFFALSVVNSILKTNERFSVPVTNAEFAVMRTSFSFMLPYLMGWDQYMRQLPTSTVEHKPEGVLRNLDLEWDK